MAGAGIYSVSIRAPPSRAGRRAPVVVTGHSKGFQSAPRPRGRGDNTRICMAAQDRVSIRAPPSRAGRRFQIGALGGREFVSIRAPPSRAGRLLSPICLAYSIMFQSAPRPRGRGDLPAVRVVVSAVVFQSAPRPRGRGDMSEFTMPTGDPAGFNPRPALAGGATNTPSAAASPATTFQSAPRPRGRGDSGPAAAANPPPSVSIRAPPSRAGRPKRSCRPSSPTWFQSAPRPRGRGDILLERYRQLKRKFQSAPRPRGRGDASSCWPRRRRSRVSIRAPPSRAGRRWQLMLKPIRL